MPAFVFHFLAAAEMHLFCFNVHNPALNLFFLIVFSSQCEFSPLDLTLYIITNQLKGSSMLHMACV